MNDFLTRTEASPRIRPAGGFSLLELLVATAILGIVALGVASSLLMSVDLNRSNRETREAELLARRAAEQMRNLEPAAMIQLAAALSDASATSTLLDALGGQPGSSLGDATVDVILPVSTTTGLVEEDLNAPEFGLPMDMNLDGAIDSADRSSDCRVLPVRIRVEWQGGRKSIEIIQVLLTANLREQADASL